MPKKGKKANRPALQHHNNDSLRRDIEAGRNAPVDGVIDPFADDNNNDDGAFDIADELLAALDERDAAAEAAEKSSSNNHSGGGLREAGGRLISGLRHHNNDNDSAAQTGTSPTHNRKSSIRKLFGSSPKSPESSAPLDAAAPKKKVSRQQQRKVGPLSSPRFPQLVTDSLHICTAVNRIVKPPRSQKCVVRPRKKSSSAPTSPTKHRSSARVSLPCARRSVSPCTKSLPTVIVSTLLSRTSSTFARSSLLPPTTRPHAAPPHNRCAPSGRIQTLHLGLGRTHGGHHQPRSRNAQLRAGARE